MILPFAALSSKTIHFHHHNSSKGDLDSASSSWVGTSRSRL